MNVAKYLPLLVALLFTVGCSSGAKAEKEPDVETTESSVEAEKVSEEPAATGNAALASCTGGNVPVGATSCRLDLETGEDSYWADTDGVDPGTAGCHTEFTDDTCGAVKDGREFGEFCLDDDRLVESNPGVDECHTHGGDLGAPDVVSCSEWCQSNSGTGGKCEGGVIAQGANGTCESARCVCG